MLELSQILDARCIKLSLESKDKEDAIKEMVDLICQSGRIKNRQRVENRLIEREKEGTTGIGGGIAIPHIMTKQVSQTVMAFMRSKEGLEFGAIDKKPVQLIFLLVGPKGEESTHLRLLCMLSRLLHNTRFKQALMRAETEEKILNIFRQQEKR